MSTFSAVALRLRKTKTAPTNGSCWRVSWQSRARPSIPAAKIGRLDGDQDLHLRRDLEHHRAFQKLRERASTSAAS